MLDNNSRSEINGIQNLIYIHVRRLEVDNINNSISSTTLKIFIQQINHSNFEMIDMLLNE